MGERTRTRRQKSNELNKKITEKDEVIDKELLKNYFYQFESLSDMYKELSKTRNAQKNKELAQEIKDKAADLSNKTKIMPKNENEKAN